MTISIKRLFIMAFLAFVLVSCVVISIISAFSITKIGTASAVNQASTVVEKALEILNGDEFERISKEMNPNDEKAENMRAELLRLAKSTSCQYLYSMIPKTDSVYTYVMDVEAGIRNEEHFTEMGTEEDISSWGTPPKKTFRDGSINHTKLEHHSEWGWQISVYGAIKNSKGKIIGLIGCDYNVDYIIRMTKKQVLLISLMGLISVILGVSTVYIFSNFLFGALDKITDAMETVSKGNADLTQRIPEQKSTELSSLAKSCNNVIERLSYLNRGTSESIEHTKRFRRYFEQKHGNSHTEHRLRHKNDKRHRRQDCFSAGKNHKRIRQYSRIRIPNFSSEHKNNLPVGRNRAGILGSRTDFGKHKTGEQKRNPHFDGLFCP